VKGTVTPPQPDANCINNVRKKAVCLVFVVLTFLQLIPGLNAMCANVTVQHYLHPNNFTEIRCWGTREYVLQGSATKADFLTYFEGKGFSGMKPACGLKIDKKIYCSGISIPESYRKLAFRNIKVGGTHACGIVGTGSNRTMYCWGESYKSAVINTTKFNAIGSAYIETTTVPPSVSIPTIESIGFQTVTTFSDNFDMGVDHACAVTTDNQGIGSRSGRLICWGNDLLTTIPCPADDTSCIGYPKFGYLAPHMELFISVSTGWYHTCIIRDIGYLQNDPAVSSTKAQAQCFGWNIWKQCNLPAGIHWLELSAGFDVTCGVGLSLKYFRKVFGNPSANPPVLPTMKLQDVPKELWCWGRNNFMQSSPPQE
jgi:hypothetical protein